MFCVERFKSNILFVRVSKKPNMNLIVQQLYQHKGYFVPSFRDNEDALIKLEQLLKEIGKEPILLVLDDVWSGSESLIDKFNFKIPELEYKILVTSRSSFRGFDTFELKLLCDENAIDIFQHYASLEDGRSDIPNDLVKEVLYESAIFV